jgi:ParD-like antitoxin of type II bacterial toxin-antitoxin system
MHGDGLVPDWQFCRLAIACELTNQVKMAQNAPLRRICMVATSTTPTASLTLSTFASVKLPAALVQQAKQAAQPLRRSVAGQIEYWATLGRVVEHSGLTVQEARTAIERYEAANKTHQAQVVSDLTSRLLAAEASGSLAQRVRDFVADNRKRAV